MGIILTVLIIILFGGWYVWNAGSDSSDGNANTNSIVLVNQNAGINKSATSDDNTNVAAEVLPETKNSPGKYIDYSDSAFSKEVGKKRVIFFHATWCPTCKIANQVFIDKANEIPEGVVIFKTDYDSEKELKSKYGITYQHTFVLVDEEGNEIKKWNGGDIDQLVNNI